MSIALQAQVDRLEKEVAELRSERDAALIAVDLIGQRVNAIEVRVQTVVDIVGAKAPPVKGARNG
jgi:hypothetical protein